MPDPGIPAYKPAPHRGPGERPPQPFVRTMQPSLPWPDFPAGDPASGLAGFFASAAWFRTLAAHACPPGAAPRPVLVEAGGRALLLPLLAEGRRLRGFSTVYTQLYCPAIGAGSDPALLEAGGRALAGLARARAPLRLDALADGPELAALLDGVRAGGRRVLRFAHFGNWHEDVAGLSFPQYMARRPGSLRETVRRRRAAASRNPALRIQTVRGPDGLEAGIAAYEAVYARSWKPAEPAPGFAAALMRAAAPLGLLRLGLLWQADTPVAAQLWIVAGGEAGVLKLAHDEAHRALSPGTVLTAGMVAALLEEDRVSELDFGRGDDPYKRLWAGGRRGRAGVLVVDPRHPAGLAALARHALGRLRAPRAGERA